MELRVLVHLHIYYHDQVEMLVRKLKNINGCRWDLVVTTPEDNPRSRELLLALKPDAEIIIVENRGYDVWPFIQVLKNTDISKYDLVLKVHTKNRMDYRVRINGRAFYDTKWRDLLVDTVLGGEERFASNLKIFEEDPKAGMVCSCSLLRTPSGFAPWANGKLRKEMERIGVPCLGMGKMHYCAGTMFIARMSPYKFIVDADLTPEMFETRQSTHSCNTLSYYYEQIFGYVHEASGLKVVTVADKWYYRVGKILHDMTTPLGFIFSLDRNNEFEYKYLTVLGMKFKLDDGPGKK